MITLAARRQRGAESGSKRRRKFKIMNIYKFKESGIDLGRWFVSAARQTCPVGRWWRWVLGTGLPPNWNSLSLLPHPQSLANVLITWNFDDPNDSHADDMVQPYRCGPNQSSGGTYLEAGDVKETFVAFFSESRWMDAPSPSPAYSCRRRQSAVSLNSLDPGSTAADGPFLIYAGKPRNCAISTHCIARFLPFPSFIAFEEETTFPSLWRPPSPSRHQVHQTKV